MAIRTLLRARISTHHFPLTIFHHNHIPPTNTNIYSHQFASLLHKTNFTSSPDVPPSNSHLVISELSRILSDYRNPHNDIESALNPFSDKISANIVEQVLKRCKNLGFSAHRFFIWANKLSGFYHSKESYHILVDILGSSKQFPLLWDFLVELKRNKSCELGQDIFWLVFRSSSRANLPVDAIRSFDKMIDFGITPSVVDVDQLLLALCKRKHMKEAKQFFDRVKDGYMLSVKSYSIMIRGWGEMGEVVEAQKLFDEMLERGFSVDLLAYNSILESVCKAGKMDEAYNLFMKMRSMGLRPDAFTYAVFIHAYCVKDDIHAAFRVLDRMKRYKLVPNVFTYNVIIKKLCKSDKVEDAYQLIDEMIERGVKPDCWSYNTILACHCDHSEVNLALRLISRMEKNGSLPDRHTYNMVLKMLIKVGRFDRVEKVWESMEGRKFYPSVSTYAVMIHGLCQKKGKLEEACRYFEMMIDEGIPPYGETCELLRNRLIGLGFAEQKDILADKMERSTSCLIQELTNIMRGNKARARLRREEETLIVMSKRVQCAGEVE
ncbi:pentatricopeptide repeat-containing protein At1g52640, mitochondrial-like [Nicotiana tabacum]|uniref:Pentatricopeptide repeat-containing protein At1g52640, mitochondrial-like n=5 Tax=Nicotiana TaxID=4085 RepID=A0A1S4C6R4_TOBAC|nr:PREDICTED: pentatricopeptide repeat-containing protein At1g52640, mitochondrial-like [Nicotiana sylvestris]XP_009802359.1 PREDICTED: pentatricopeptide repeat-containing protein At1g52640, mitochondrial-like [Nicotiana sylvestris]XP_009802360.1 PREDICTED: pentatricopeptide repeat-containing protein At1g52640, mitochondrial-like [Nicotiana sylvestris]XP_009802361.1 PREDICTED: pentatricopeptide repeat-containing protein At1g52640, mitochondrial-like [Nicotiana sylvestris]XP_009802362.1 PREDICTE